MPPKFTGEVEAWLTVLARSDPPEGVTRWTLRLLANRMAELGHVGSLRHVTTGEIQKTSSSPVARILPSERFRRRRGNA